MKIKRTDAHDRLLEFEKQADYISQGCIDCIKNRPEEFGNHPFYIYAHKRTIEPDERISIFNHDIWSLQADPTYERKYKCLQDVPTARMIWEPRLTKPYPQENSMLFKAYPPGDTIKVIWILPERELWDQFTKGKLTENKAISESIYNFKNNINKLTQPDEEDLSDHVIDMIYEQISINANTKRGKFKRVF